MKDRYVESERDDESKTQRYINIKKKTMLIINTTKHYMKGKYNKKNKKNKKEY